MSTCIKFCGLNRIEDIQYANELKPEYVGFVFWEKSKRHVTREEVIEFRKTLLPEIKVVGVFVDEYYGTVAELLNKGIIDIAQLHGNEDEEYIKTLKTRSFNKPIMKAFVIRDWEDILIASKSSADYLLLDSGAGTGHTFNWELIRGTQFEQPVFLAGGLDSDNVVSAIKAVHPYAVDVSSGIEVDGVKNYSLMWRFERKVRKYEEN